MTPVALVRDEFRICLDEGHRCIMMQYSLAVEGTPCQTESIRIQLPLKISAGQLEFDSLGMFFCWALTTVIDTQIPGQRIP